MVVAAFISYFAPSNRGFNRVKEADKVPIDSFHNDCGTKRRQSVTTLKRKPLRAMAVLTSFASDFDLISDWMFCYQTFKQDRIYREKYAEDPDDGELPYLIPPTLLTCVFISCVLGTITYLVLATEGRIVAPCMQRLRVDKISMGFVLFISVLVEDIPQVILTFLVEDYYEEGQFLSDLAVFNLMASIYDTLIKLAESFDQRHDVVETGVWCKCSITGHKATITDVLVLPESHIMPPPDNQKALSEPILPRRSSYFLKSAAVSRGQSGKTDFDNVISQSNLGNISFQRTSTRPLLVEAFFPEEETFSPRIHFLTASMDGTVKLWDISSYNEDDSNYAVTRNPEKQCARVFQDMDSKGFTCMAWVGANSTLMNENKDEDKTRCSYFLTGCNSGAAKLWDLSGVCRGDFVKKEDQHNNRVASIAATMVGDEHTFLCGHENGAIRIWGTWTGHCLGEFIAHEKRITSVRFLQDGHQFVSASTDSSLKLWDLKNHVAINELKEMENITQKEDSDSSIQLTAKLGSIDVTTCSNTPDHRVKAVRNFLGHTGAILSVVVVDDKTALLSGSRDGTARLWSIASGFCLRIFRGHTDSVTTVQAIDRVTFLTGSKDTTIKAWDALSGECLRTYEGHTNIVTGLTVVSVSPDETEKASTFMSSSVDRSIKCWVLTSISYRDPVATLEHILDFHENACRCFDRSGVYATDSPPTKAAVQAEKANNGLCGSCGRIDSEMGDYPYYQEEHAYLKS